MPHGTKRRFSLALTMWLSWAGTAAETRAQVEVPACVDGRLAVELFAQDPDLVTPTGIAVDTRGRVLVVESNTHFPPEGYKGWPTDRIRSFEDLDGDGRAERVGTFFDGTKFTMNLAFERDGSVLVATRYEVFRLRDRDDDGVADERTSLAHLETTGDYPHNGLSGFAVDHRGRLYFGLGENLGAAYRLVGTDGSSCSGGGEGGSVFRCGADGSEMTRVATGFWNPFHVCFDAFERLFAVDNDPDSRPPCRLLHLVERGDYGYRYRNGRKGLHPFTAWNGELPGTLPMLAGTGEAPSGIVSYESDGLPKEYVGCILGTSWGDHRLERFELRRRGASWISTGEPFVRGGENFRPVGICVAPDGSLFVSDWVDKSYTLHGKGRIWHVRAATQVKPNRPTEPLTALESADRASRERAARELASQPNQTSTLLRAVRENANPRVRAAAWLALCERDPTLVFHDQATDVLAGQDSEDLRELLIRLAPADRQDLFRKYADDPAPAVRAASLRRLADLADLDRVLASLGDSDPFVQQAAREGLRNMSSVDELVARAGTANSEAERMACLILLRESTDPRAHQAVPGLLADMDPSVRFSAVQWVGEHGLQEYRQQVLDILATGANSRLLFEGCLATLERLDGVHREPGDELAGEEYIVKLLQAQPSASVQRFGLRMLRPDHPYLTLEKLRELLGSADANVQLEVIRTLRERAEPEAGEMLLSIVSDAGRSVEQRAEAILGLSAETEATRELLISLALGDNATLRDEALRTLRGSSLSELQQKSLATLLGGDGAVGDLVHLLLRPQSPPDTRATNASGTAERSAWLQILAEAPGDANAGARIFFHPRGPRCSTCHEVDGRGGRAGPALSAASQGMTRERIVDSILTPSKEIAPLYVPWSIVKTDGTQAQGLLIREAINGDQTYLTSTGETFTLARDQIEHREPLRTSIMPDKIHTTMTRQEFRDLLAFLLQGKESSH